MVPTDPVSDDFFCRVVEQKSARKPTNKSLAQFLKILANSGSYGLFVQMDQEKTGKPVNVKVFSGEISHEGLYRVVEKAGPWYFPPLASLITAGGRLLLAMLEKSVTDAGGSYLFCDTDSLCIVSSEQGELVPCQGGPRRLEDASEAIKALSWQEGSGTIPDTTLKGCRNSFVWLLENYWGQIGYELWQALTTDHIRNVFGSLPDPARNQFQLFWRPYSLAAKTLEQRRTYKAYIEVSKQAEVARKTEENRRHSLDVALSALRAAQGTNQQQAMEHERDVRDRAFKEATQHRLDLETQQHELTEQMEDEATGFSQTELLHFINERRYELIPINFANAMAGLPSMGWRQSFKRCMCWPFANSLAYREFKIISAFLRSDVKAESLVERMGLYLERKKLNKETRDPVAQLKQNWYYLRKAIERIEEEKHPADAVPFRIMAEYQRLYGLRTPVDEILAEEEARLW